MSSRRSFIVRATLALAGLPALAAALVRKPRPRIQYPFRATNAEDDHYAEFLNRMLASEKPPLPTFVATAIQPQDELEWARIPPWQVEKSYRPFASPRALEIGWGIRDDD